MNIDQYMEAIGWEAMPDYWQQMDLERRAWEEDQACQAEWDLWVKTLNEPKEDNGTDQD